MSTFREPDPPPDVVALLEDRERLAARIAELRAAIPRARKLRRWKRAGVVVGVVALIEVVAVIAAKMVH